MDNEQKLNSGRKMSLRSMQPGYLKIESKGINMPFMLNPSEIKLERSFNFNQLPLIGENQPAFNFVNDNAATLSFKLAFDQDINAEYDLGQTQGFMETMASVDPASKSVPDVVFGMGNLKFQGYVTSYVFEPKRFNNNGEIVGLELAITMVSSAEKDFEWRV